MTKITTIVAGVLLVFCAPVFADQAQDIATLKKQVRDLSKKAGGAHLKFKVDYRVTMDSLEYKFSDGANQPNPAKQSNSNLFANRLEIGMGYQPFRNLVFNGLLSYNKAFGENNFNDDGTGQFDWVVNENPNENVLRVKEVNILYLGKDFLGSNLEWSGSIGRRPSTNGFLANNREGYDNAKSPLGHSINVEFDGFSLGVDLENATNVSGMAAKLCAGRGLSAYGKGRFSQAGSDYAKTELLQNVDMAGLIFTPYNNGQYDIQTQYYYAVNMLDYNYSTVPFPSPPTKMTEVGDLQNLTVSMQVNGVGEFINDFLDDTVLFASASGSQTLPDNNNTGYGNTPQGMLGSPDKKVGYSLWAGATFPAFIANDRFGLEYNYGSKYWRSFTYGEDTVIGSKIAARGSAYEAYYNMPIIGKILYFQLRYTYINYNHAGSNSFFGNSGAPSSPMAYVQSAQDLRAMIRYKY